MPNPAPAEADSGTRQTFRPPAGRCTKNLIPNGGRANNHCLWPRRF